jgi:hypothetical protein
MKILDELESKHSSLFVRIVKEKVLKLSKQIEMDDDAKKAFIEETKCTR